MSSSDFMQLDLTQSSQETVVLAADKKAKKPSVFEYVDYRQFLNDTMEFKRQQNPSFSATAFLKQAGFRDTSRGYFGLIIKGKRNLSSHTLLGFGQACRLNDGEMNFFENLVHYNQARNEKDKTYYFERLTKTIRGNNRKSFELLSSQYHYFSNWYLVAIRELVNLDDFQETTEWISSRLRKRVNAKQVTDGIEHLLTLGLLKRNEKGRLVQSEEFVEFSDNSMNYTIVNRIHQQVLELAGQSLEQDDYDNRSVSSVMITCDENDFKEIRQEIKAFRQHVMQKYGKRKSKLDSIVNLGIQLFHITPISKKRSST